MSEKTQTTSDTDFLRSLKRLGAPQSAKETAGYNERLERIAKYLEGITCPKIQ